MLSRLDAETGPHHASADAPWLALLRPDVGSQAYIRQLAATYGFESPVESAVQYTPGIRDLVGVREHARSGHLAHDLLALGLTPTQVTELPQCFSITFFEDIAEALGWLYVVERTTKHYELVRRNILERLPVARYAATYLTAGSDPDGARWRAFGALLDELATTDAIAERIVKSAARGFRRLRLWKETSQPQLRSAG